jgi:hypothetical protein
MTKRELRRCARILRGDAATNRNSYMSEDQWTGDPGAGYSAKQAEREHAELLDLATKLDALAKVQP